MLKYDIPRRAATCSVKQESLRPGTEVISVIVSTSAGYERRDFCCACWDDEAQELWKEQMHWRHRLPLKERAPPAHFDEKAFRLLQEWCSDEREEPEQEAMAYQLALYLERKDQIIRQGQQGDTLFFESVHLGEGIAVKRRIASTLPYNRLLPKSD